MENLSPKASEVFHIVIQVYWYFVRIFNGGADVLREPLWIFIIPVQRHFAEMFNRECIDQTSIKVIIYLDLVAWSILSSSITFAPYVVT